MNFFIKQNAFVLISVSLCCAPIIADEIGPTHSSLNFGVVVYNPVYTIYRSAHLGKSELKHLKKILKEDQLPFPRTIIYMNSNGYKFPLYHAVEEYEALISLRYGPVDYYHSFDSQVRTYVDGHNPYAPTLDIDQGEPLGHKAREYFTVTPDDGIDGGMENVLRVLGLILDANNQPVLFHCHGGMHRTGMIGMILRYLQGGEWVDGPKVTRYGMALNPAQYEYYKFNSLFFRKENIEFVEQFAQDPRFIDLKNAYGQLLQNSDCQDLPSSVQKSCIARKGRAPERSGLVGP